MKPNPSQVEIDIQQKIDVFLRTKLNHFLQANDKQTSEIKTEINAGLKSLTGKLEKANDKIHYLESKVQTPEKKLRRNNVIVFGLEHSDPQNPLGNALSRLKELLNIDLKLRDINHARLMKKEQTNSPILLDFV
ncbi:hypothetical protein JTB14_025836 [Gonioctena quinquepunctata]|nr:hypothetical protein JTB14_025836 [Gonioctena quinquepunctata]